MSNKSIVILAVVALAVAGGIAGARLTEGEGQQRQGPSNDSPDAVPAATIVMTEEGFSPRDVTIRAGEAVRFVNATGEGFFWPASNLHPTHELYPEFDPREPIEPGESWTFIFEDQGEWAYHDHLKSRIRGTVTVTE